MAFCVHCGTASSGGSFCTECGAAVGGDTATKLTESKKVTTTIENQANILADLWLNYRNDEEFTDFVTYNDLGLPLAYAISEGIVKMTESAQSFIEETFSLLLAGLDVEDIGYEELDDILQNAE